MMYRLMIVVCLVIAGAAVVQGPTVTHAAGKSTTAKICQKGGYLTLQGSDGTRFSTEEQCVSYAAQGGTLMPIPTCSVTTTSGCISLSGVTLLNSPSNPDGGTITLSGLSSFSPLTTCTPGPCGAASGGGTYTVAGGIFNGGTGGTWQSTATQQTVFQTNGDLIHPPSDTTCALASVQAIYVNATFTDSVTHQTTSQQIYVLFTNFAPAAAYLEVPNGGVSEYANYVSTGATVAC